MKTAVKLLLIFTLFSCQRKPDLLINGKEYYINDVCVKDTIYYKYGYHYGYNSLRNKFEYHYGGYTENECLQWRIDTIEVKK